MQNSIETIEFATRRISKPHRAQRDDRKDSPVQKPGWGRTVRCAQGIDLQTSRRIFLWAAQFCQRSLAKPSCSCSVLTIHLTQVQPWLPPFTYTSSPSEHCFSSCTKCRFQEIAGCIDCTKTPCATNSNCEPYEEQLCASCHCGSSWVCLCQASQL